MKKARDEMNVAMSDEGLEVLAEEFGEMRISLFTLPPGFDLEPVFAPMPDGHCPVPHWGRVLEGELRLRYADGTEEVTRAGDFFHWPAGHVGRTETGVVWIDICPAAEAREVDGALAAAAADG
jgi:hypothetical protein